MPKPPSRKLRSPQVLRGETGTTPSVSGISPKAHPGEMPLEINQAESALRPPRIPTEPLLHAPSQDHFQLAPPSPAPGVMSWRPGPSLPALHVYGRFEVLGRLARGGMAEILLARENTSTGIARHVVIKRVHPSASDDAEFIRMFLDEARLVMSLNHPNICHIYDVGQQDGTWFIAMEWIRGVPLARVIRRARSVGGVPVAIAVRIIATVAEALHYVHTAKDATGMPLGLVHRDVSPQNIMIGYDGKVKLLDFGIAKTNNYMQRTASGVLRGKCAYMAPEQCLNRPLDGRADVFALGICLYELLTGASLFRKTTEYETLRAILDEPVPSILTADETLPRDLDRIVQTSLHKEQSHRYATAEAFQLALEQFLADGRHVITSNKISRFVRKLYATEIEKGPVLGPVASSYTDSSGSLANPLHIASLKRPSPTGFKYAFLVSGAIAIGAAAGLVWRTQSGTGATPTVATRP